MIDAGDVWVGHVFALLFMIVANYAVTKAEPLSKLLVGEDGRRSTSKTTAAMWTAIVMYVLVFIAAVSLRAQVLGFDELLAEGLQDEYLILLGGPFVALVAARGIVGAKVRDGTLQKVESKDADGDGGRGDANGDGGPAPGVVTDDDGKTDLVDLQYFGFNLVVAAYVIGVFLVRSANLPSTDLAAVDDFSLLVSIPPTLFALTSAAALTYVGNKAAVRNEPVISGITPAEVRPGGRFTIHGTNFVPSGAPSGGTRGIEVTVGEATAQLQGRAGTPPEVSGTRIVAYAPLGLDSDHHPLSVTTAAGAVVEGRTIRIVEDTPALHRIEPSRLTAGRWATLVGRFLRLSDLLLPASDQDESMRLTIRLADNSSGTDETTPSEHAISDSVRFKVPAVNAGTYTMTVTRSDGKSIQRSVQVTSS